MLIIAVLSGGSSEAQRRGGGRGGFSVRPAEAQDFDGSWQFCRVAFRGNRDGDGAGWSVDFPRADINMSVRLSELTKTTVSVSGPQEPNHLVIRLTDATLFQCPFVMMTEVGNSFITDEEAEALRNYLLKGGFLWADDFWGEYAWQVWAEQIAKALPPAQYPPRDLAKDHPLFRALFDIGAAPQIASIGFWLGSGGGTSERGADSDQVHARGIFDQQGRLMVLSTHNTDIGDSWEEEASHPQYFYEFSTKGYAFGINTIVYAMTH
ncbi:MAG: DUF4159 domain-containing protein [Acidimicrobiia bacterium]|nr:DUF4159 domain-containing protein [Acidimicrobiia bacterium]